MTTETAWCVEHERTEEITGVLASDEGYAPGAYLARVRLACRGIKQIVTNAPHLARMPIEVRR